MRALTIFIIASLSLILLFLLRLHIAGETKTIVPYSRGYSRCQKIGQEMIGSEDMVLSKKLNKIIVSSMDRRTKDAVGGIYLLDPESLRYQKFTLENYPSKDFHPHGISNLDTENGVLLFIINHIDKHYVDVFRVNDRAMTLIHIKRYNDNNFISPNDLVAFSENEFYFTNDHGSKAMGFKALEDLFMAKKASVVQVLNGKSKIVIDQLSYANGIDKSDDGNLLYVSETIGESVRVYDKKNNFNLLSFTDVHSGADNLFVQGDDIYVASHPKLFSFVLMAAKVYDYSPTQIQRVFKKDGKYVWEDTFVSLGNDVSDASIAILTHNKLFIGSVFDKGIFVCLKQGK